MPDVKISALPAGTANANAVVPATNAAGTTTQKITLGAIAALGGGPPASHSHGNLTNAGAIGTTANLPVITTTSGVLTAGSFGTGANTFCQGNDSRLSDSRTPTSHASSHHTGGGDALTPGNIGAAVAPVVSITTLDQGVTSTTLTDATNMSFSAAANATYLVSMLIVALDDGGGDWEAKIAVPSGADAYGYWDQLDNGIPITTDVPVTTRCALLMSTANGLYAFPRQFVVKTAGTSGTVKLQFAQNSTSPGSAAVLQAGSWISAQRVA